MQGHSIRRWSAADEQFVQQVFRMIAAVFDEDSDLLSSPCLRNLLARHAYSDLFLTPS